MTRASLLSRRILGPLFGLALAALPALAQDPAPEPSPEPEPPAIDVAGFVDVYWGYNFNETEPVALRTFDIQHHTFALSQAEVAFSKGVSTDSRVGFRVDLGFGPTADLVAAFEPAEDGQEVFKHVQQAYVSALAGDKVQFDVGKFVTPIGAEVIESQDNWNYTRSVLFGFAIPFYHFGVRATVTASDKVTLSGFLLNGWNNGTEVNDDKTFAFGATVKPSDKVTWIGNVIVGKEAPGADTRTLFDTTLTLTASPKLSLMGNFDYGTEGDVSWWGLAAYAKLQATDNWALVGRYEYLDDGDGGFMTIGGSAQTLTVTSDHLIAGGLKMRLEYRTDFTDAPFFVDSDGDLKESQSTVTVGLVYGFGGKL